MDRHARKAVSSINPDNLRIRRGFTLIEMDDPFQERQVSNRYARYEDSGKANRFFSINLELLRRISFSQLLETPAKFKPFSEIFELLLLTTPAESCTAFQYKVCNSTAVNRCHSTINQLINCSNREHQTWDEYISNIFL